jgi:hypothetical protein
MLADGKLAVQLSKTDPPRATGLVVLVGNNRPIARLELELVRRALDQAERINNAADRQTDQAPPPHDRD